MNCIEFKENLDALIDGELPVTKEKAAVDHSNKCEECRSLYFTHKRIKQLVKKCCTKQPAPEHLCAQIKRLIHEGEYSISKEL